MVATMRHLLVALLLLAAVGSAEAQTFGSSTVETSTAALTNVSNVFTPSCPTLGGGFAVQNIIVTAANQSIVTPASCPGSSVGLFVTFNICNGKGGTAPCNGTASGPFSPGITFGLGFEFPGTAAYAVNSTNANNVSGAKDIVTCEVMGTTGPWSCGAPQYAMTGTVLIAQAQSTLAAGALSSNTISINLTAGATLILGISQDGGVSVSSITGTGIGTCTPFSGGGINSALEYCTLTATNNAVTVTVNMSGAIGHLWIGGMVFANVAASPDDGIGHANAPGSFASLTVSGTGTTTEANELIVAVGIMVAAETMTAGTGYTLSNQTNISGWTAFVEWGFQAATGTPIATATASGAASYEMTLAGVKH